MTIYVCLYTETSPFARHIELMNRARECCARSPEESAARLLLHYPGCGNDIALCYPARAFQLERMS